LSDRFSDNGIVGVLILRQRSARQWEVDTFLMSCRIIGRTVENAFVGHACRALKERGANELIGEYIPTKKNALAANIYRDLGFEPFEDRWRLALDEKPVAIPQWIDVEVAEALHA
jgi:FkbH-like protein